MCIERIQRIQCQYTADIVCLSDSKCIRCYPCELVNGDDCACPCFPFIRQRPFHTHTHETLCITRHVRVGVWNGRHEILNENECANATTAIHSCRDSFIRFYRARLKSAPSLSAANCAKNPSSRQPNCMRWKPSGPFYIAPLRPHRAHYT